MKLSKTLSKAHPEKIKYYYLLKSEHPAEAPRSQVHLPDGTFELIINFGSTICQGNSSGDFVPRPKIALMGGFKKHHCVKYGGGVHLIGLVFHPVYVSQILKDSISQHDELCISAESIFGNQVNLLAEQLFLQEDMNFIGDTLDQFLSNHTSSIKGHSAKIKPAYDFMIKHPAQARVDQIADMVCMSPRNFRRNFSETTGYSPKEMLCIIRSKRLVHLLKKGVSIRDAAWSFRYYDASHLLHDFKRISGTSPSQYIKNMNVIDLNFFEKSEYASLDQLPTQHS